MVFWCMWKDLCAFVRRVASSFHEDSELACDGACLWHLMFNFNNSVLSHFEFFPFICFWNASVYVCGELIGHGTEGPWVPIPIIAVQNKDECKLHKFYIQ